MLCIILTCLFATFILSSPIRANYETGDTIILEAIQPPETVENPDSPGPKKFPYLVSLLKDGVTVCSGALLDNHHVISSAFCMSNITNEDISKYQLGIGYQSFENDKPTPGESEGPYYVRRLSKVIMDRSFYYESLKLENSLLLLKLDMEVTFNDFVQPIHLPDNATIPPHRVKHPLPPLRTAKLTGWRKGNGQRGKESAFLRGVTMRIYDYEECLKEVGSSNVRMENILCASSTINNPCHFALGSTLVAKRYGKNLLIGLRERDCHFPTVFTRTEYFLPWIRRNLIH